MNKYYIEIDISDTEATGYEDRFNWVSYGAIQSQGNTLDELMENATVDLVDQDGGEAAIVEANEAWMQDLIAEEFKRITSVRFKMQQLRKKILKPFKPLSYFERSCGKKPNFVQKLLYK